jgi:hypothetical protein
MTKSMFRFFLVCWVAFFGLSSVALATELFDGDPISGGVWDSQGTHDGVVLYRKRVAETKLFAVRGDIVIKASLKNVAEVIENPIHWTGWAEGGKNFEILEEVPGKPRVVYQTIDLPPLVKDRDVVYAFGSKPLGDGVLIEGRSLPYLKTAYPKDTVGVRADMIIGRWIVTPLSANETNIQMEVLIDPEGWLPDWLVNMVQRTYPVGLLVGLRDYIDGLDFAAEEAAAPAP